MRNKILKTLSLILAVMIAVVSCLTFAFADTNVGSITVVLEYNNTPVTTGGVLTLYQVATINSDGSYSYTSDFVGYSDASAIVDALEDKNAAWLLWQWANTVGATGTTSDVGSDGTVTFSDVVAGIYLIVPTTSPTYFNMGPSLVSVPNVFGTGEYDVTVEAKLEYEALDTPDEPTPTTTTVVTEPDTEVTTDGSGGEEGNGDDEVDVEEEPEPEKEEDKDTLHQTGQLNKPITIMAGAGVFCIAAGIIVAKTDKNK